MSDRALWQYQERAEPIHDTAVAAAPEYIAPVFPDRLPAPLRIRDTGFLVLPIPDTAAAVPEFIAPIFPDWLPPARRLVPTGFVVLPIQDASTEYFPPLFPDRAPPRTRPVHPAWMQAWAAGGQEIPNPSTTPTTSLGRSQFRMDPSLTVFAADASKTGFDPDPSRTDFVITE